MKITKLVVAGSAALAVVGLAGCGQMENTAQSPSSAPSAPSAPSSAPDSASTSAPGTDPSPPAATGVPTSSADCKAADLRLTLGHGDAGAGSVYRPLVFTNKSSRTCLIQGFPGVSYVTGDNGTQVGDAATRVPPKGPVIHLAPGQSVSADVQFAQAGNFDQAACKPTPVRGLRVYPPHDTASMFVPMSTTGCAGHVPDPQLQVQTVK